LACLKCGVVGNLYRHGPKPIYIRDSPIRGRPVRIQANAQRYKCRECGGTFIQPLGGIQAATRMTERCVEYIESQCLRDTFLRVAEHVGCDDRTVRNIAGDYIHRLASEYKPWLPEWLGIDETMIDGDQRCVLTDVVNRRPVDMLENRDQSTVTSWLYQFKDRRSVKGLAMDMWPQYKRAALAVFPGLPIVVDKFHVVKMANKAMDEVRVILAKEQYKATGKDWMRRKVLLRMRYKNLSEKGRFNLQMWLDNEPEVAVAYRIKEAFYDIYDAPTKDDAGRLLDEWRQSIPANMKKGKKSFAPLLTATRNWRTEILAFWDHPITNGYTEALNGVAKVINRSGRGYSFDVLRARLLFGKPAARKEPEDLEEIDMAEPTVEIVTIPRNNNALVRAMLLKTLGERCSSCGGVFAPAELFVTRMGPLLEDEPTVNKTLLCQNCKVRFHTERASGHSSPSTR
jgi:transposase